MLGIDDIEDGIITHLQTQLTYLKTVASIAEYFREETEDLTMVYPAAYVIYIEGIYDHSISSVQDRGMTFAVLCMSKHVRGDLAARHGYGSQKGAYDIINDVRGVLTDHSCGLDIDPLLPVREYAATGTKAMAAYAIEFKTRCRTIL